MECEGCNNVYNLEERRPRSLPCGHTLCSNCISAILKDNKVICVKCHAGHYAVAVVQFPVNYDMEQGMRAVMMDVDATPTPSPSPVSLSAAAGSIQDQQLVLTKELIDLKEEKLRKLINTGARVQSTMKGLDQYHIQVKKMKEEHNQLQSQLEELIMLNHEKIRFLGEEQARVRELEEQYEADLEILRGINSED